MAIRRESIHGGCKDPTATFQLVCTLVPGMLIVPLQGSSGLSQLEQLARRVGGNVSFVGRDCERVAAIL